MNVKVHDLMTESLVTVRPDASLELVRARLEEVDTVPRYADVSLAARVMRNHRIHRVVVTHEQRAVGMLSAFDLLRLVEDHRYVAKPAPTPPGRRGAPRR